MNKRGRKSIASLTIAKNADIGVAKRLSPPATMSNAEMSVWAEVVNDQPAGAFTATHSPLLEMYCRHVVNNRIISDEVMNFDRAWLADEDGLRRYDTLLKLSERESRAASSLATRLRITRQAVDQQIIARSIVNNKSQERKPWELLQHNEELES